MFDVPTAGSVSQTPNQPQDMKGVRRHSRRASVLGETAARLAALGSRAPLFSEKEKTVLAWTEAAILISQSRVSDAVYAAVHQWFTEVEIVKLAVANRDAWTHVHWPDCRHRTCAVSATFSAARRFRPAGTPAHPALDKNQGLPQMAALC
jgi:hypothetical protein